MRRQVRRPVVPGPAVDRHPADVGGQQTGEDPHERGLARAVGSEQREHLAVGDLEGRVDGQRAALDPDVDVKAHSAAPERPSQRSRSSRSVASETTSRTSDRTIAASGSRCSAR